METRDLPLPLDLLFLKLPFAVRPGLTGSRAKMQSNTGLIFRCQGVKVSQGGLLVGANSQIS